MNKTGILGGTFDPIHNGHLFIAQNAACEFALDSVVFIPTGQTPHKNNNQISDKLHRYEMTRLACEDNPLFFVSDVEVKREQTCYTIDTIRELKAANPNTQYYYIIGYDCLHELPMWKDYKSLFHETKIIAVRRANNYSEDPYQVISKYEADYGAEILLLDIPIIEFSSTDIRQRVAGNKTVKYMLPCNVEAYIIANGLYSG